MTSGPAEGTLRVIDFGQVSALRSQTLWHALAYGVSAGAPPTLAFMRPAEPYVSIGYHRMLEEVDTPLPVFRRMVGGGPVYLDEGQLFFQIVVPAEDVPPRRDEALRRLLAPAVEAFNAVGIPASLDGTEVVVGDRKICGHGAGQIEDAVVVVGNLIERFDHAAATRILRLPDPAMRTLVERLMRRFVQPTPAEAAAFRSAAARAYASALRLAPALGALTPGERARLAELDRLFVDEEWLRGPDRPLRAATQVKIRAGVFAVAAEHEGARVLAAVVGERIELASVTDPDLNGAAASVGRSLRGLSLEEAGAALVELGPPGARLAAALAKSDRRAAA